MAAMLQLVTHDPAAMFAAMPIIFGSAIVILLLLMPQIAALAREALGLRTGNAFLQFPFGADTWRLTGAYLLFYVVLIVLYVLLLICAFVFGMVAHSLSGQMPPAAVGLIGLALGLFVICAVLYITVRMSFLIPPVVVAEKKISLIRTWELTKGNFWRIFAIIVALLLPFLIVEFAYIHIVYGGNFLPALHAAPERLDAFMRHQQETNQHGMALTQQCWFIYFPESLLISLVALGMFSAAAAFSYRTLAGEGEEAA